MENYILRFVAFLRAREWAIQSLWNCKASDGTEQVGDNTAQHLHEPLCFDED